MKCFSNKMLILLPQHMTMYVPKIGNISFRQKKCFLPKVELRLLTNFPLQSLMIKQDFPTAASPAKTILNILSGSLCDFLCGCKRRNYKMLTG